MQALLKSIEDSVATKNWYSALSLSLVIPDICGQIEGEPHGKKRYIAWFDRYLTAKYGGYLSGRDCYALRCSFLHAGSDVIEQEQVKEVLDKFIFRGDGSHCNRMSGCFFGDPSIDGKEVLQLAVNQFAADFVEATRQWMADNASNTTVAENLKSILKVHDGPAKFGGLVIS